MLSLKTNFVEIFRSSLYNLERNHLKIFLNLIKASFKTITVDILIQKGVFLPVFAPKLGSIQTIFLLVIFPLDHGPTSWTGVLFGVFAILDHNKQLFVMLFDHFCDLFVLVLLKSQKLWEFDDSFDPFVVISVMKILV